MTRFVYIADTHLGAAEGYHQQPRYAAHLPALIQALDAWIREQGDIDFVLHGGDMVDHATPESLRAASAVFQMAVPVYLCLGNHDVTAPEAHRWWLDCAPAFFPARRLTYSVPMPDCILHIVPTQWCATPYLWVEEQTPHFLEAQHAYLLKALARRPDVPHLLCTHSEVLGVPPEQTGMAAPDHAPPVAFTQTVCDLIRQFPHLRGVLSGHNHINTHQMQGAAHLVTVSALVETPFEFKVFTVTAPQSSTPNFAMTTVNLLPRMTFKAAYDFDKTFVQGRRKDRAFADESIHTSTP